MTFIDEISESEGVPVHVSRGEALVGHVEVGQEVLLLEQGGHLLPLFRRGVHTSGVVSACVEHDDGALGDVLDVLHGPGEVQSTGGGVVVCVAANIEARKFEYGSVIAPGGFGQVDGLVGGPVLRDELRPDPERAGAGDALHCHVPAVLQYGTVRTKCQLGRLLAEVALAPDGSVLLVQLGGDDILLGLRTEH